MNSYPMLIEASAKVIKSLRENAGLSQRKLAAMSTVNRVYLLQLEQGKYRLTLNTLFFLADALQISATELVEKIAAECEKINKEK